MRIQGDISLRQAFVVDGDDLEAIWKLLSARYGPPKCGAECVDGTTLSPEGLKDLLSYQNTRRRAISLIRLSATNSDHSAGATITFGGYEAVSASMAGDEEEVLIVREGLAAIIERTRPWFWPLARLNVWMLAAVLFLLLSLSGQLASSGSTQSDDLSWRAAVATAATSMAVLALAVASVWAIGKAWRWLFPMATFSIGNGKNRHAHAERVRWGVVIALVVSLVAGVLTDWIRIPLST